MSDVWPKGAPRVGQRAESSRRVDAKDIALFTRISGDRKNSLHYDEEAVTPFQATTCKRRLR